jgi:glycosyltransferase involved in cell wall biosynthesis
MDDLAWLSQLDALILDSTETMDVARNVGVSETALTLLPWGVDVTVFTPDGAVADTTSWDLRDGANVILSLRAHEPLYRVADILEAFSVIAGDDPNVVLIIGNTGSLTTELERQAERLGVLEQVRFIGSLDEDDLPALLRRADAYVSASEVDGSSVTLLQAMACGTPVVVSDTPGNLSWVTDGETGFTFPVGDPHSLASALARATGQPHPSVRRSAITRVRHDADWVANLQRLKSAMLGL